MAFSLNLRFFNFCGPVIYIGAKYVQMNSLPCLVCLYGRAEKTLPQGSGWSCLHVSEYLAILIVNVVIERQWYSQGS